MNEVLAVLLLAAKFDKPVCPHAGGVGLCEYVQHLSLIDYICVSGALENRVLEYVDHLHEHFVTPVQIENGCYMPPTAPGYSIEMKPESLARHEFGGSMMFAGTTAPAAPSDFGAGEGSRPTRRSYASPSPAAAANRASR